MKVPKLISRTLAAIVLLAGLAFVGLAIYAKYLPLFRGGNRNTLYD